MVCHLFIISDPNWEKLFTLLACGNNLTFNVKMCGITQKASVMNTRYFQ